MRKYPAPPVPAPISISVLVVISLRRIHVPPTLAPVVVPLTVTLFPYVKVCHSYGALMVAVYANIEDIIPNSIANISILLKFPLLLWFFRLTAFFEWFLLSIALQLWAAISVLVIF